VTRLSLKRSPLIKRKLAAFGCFHNSASRIWWWLIAFYQYFNHLSYYFPLHLHFCLAALYKNKSRIRARLVSCLPGRFLDKFSSSALLIKQRNLKATTPVSRTRCVRGRNTPNAGSYRNPHGSWFWWECALSDSTRGRIFARLPFARTIRCNHRNTHGRFPSEDSPSPSIRIFPESVDSIVKFIDRRKSLNYPVALSRLNGSYPCGS
jgi:hypothetical protein